MFQNLQLALKYFSGRMASAGARGVLQYALGLLTAVVGLGVISQGQGAELASTAQSLWDATAALANAMSTFLGKLLAFVSAVTMVWSMFKASPGSQAAGITAQGMTVQAPDDIAAAISSPAVMPASSTTVVTAPQIAKAMPDNARVLSSADVKVVDK